MTSVDMFEASKAAWHALEQLNRRNYVPAMGAICLELSLRYGVLLADSEAGRLIPATLDLAHQAAAGGVDQSAWRQAADSWNTVVDIAERDPAVEYGFQCALVAFAGFAWELNSVVDHYSAARATPSAFKYFPSSLGGTYAGSPFGVIVLTAGEMRPATDLNARLLEACSRCAAASSAAGGLASMEDLHRQVFGDLR